VVRGVRARFLAVNARRREAAMILRRIVETLALPGGVAAYLRG
jgi:hypothetical protein